MRSEVKRYGELAMRAERIRDRLRAQPSLSDRALARELNCHHSAVNRVRHELADERDFEEFDEPRRTPDLTALDVLDERCTDLEGHARQLLHDVVEVVAENRRLRKAVGR